LLALAAAAPADVPLFDPDDDLLLGPGDMPVRIKALCRAGGQAPPVAEAEIVRSILVSLACKYRFVFERLETLLGYRFDVVHIVGGGVRNQLLCQLTADLIGLPVIAGPEEATALGNVLVQARAAGDLDGSLADLRKVAAASSSTVDYQPGSVAYAEDTYSRFLAVTELAAASAPAGPVPATN
jgi:rhamnulokinase